MNKRAMFFGLLYAAVVIVYKLVIFLGGYAFSKFGFYYSNLLSNLLMIPFFFICIQQVRNKENDGFIAGREAIRLAFTVLAVSMIFISAYNYFEIGSEKFKSLAAEYYNGEEYRNILLAQQPNYPEKLKTENFPAIIKEQITGLSPFKGATFKLIPMLIFGLGGGFMASIALRRKRVQS